MFIHEWTCKHCPSELLACRNLHTSCHLLASESCQPHTIDRYLEQCFSVVRSQHCPLRLARRARLAQFIMENTIVVHALYACSPLLLMTDEMSLLATTNLHCCMPISYDSSCYWSSMHYITWWWVKGQCAKGQRRATCMNEPVPTTKHV